MSRRRPPPGVPLGFLALPELTPSRRRRRPARGAALAIALLVALLLLGLVA